MHRLRVPLAAKVHVLAIALLASMGSSAQALPPTEQRAAAGQTAAAESAEPERPNILVVFTDDQRFDELSVMPETRAWFKTGVTFSRGVVTTPMCCPSRGSIYTGQYVHNHHVWDNRSPENLDQTTTTQYYLQRAGYRTAYVGKYLNHWDLCNEDPPYFDRFAIRTQGRYEGARYRTMEPTGQNVRCRGGGDGHTKRVPYDTTFIEQTALDYLGDFNENADQDPWLMYVSAYAPHTGATPEDRYTGSTVPAWDKSPAVDEQDLSDKPPHVRDTSRKVYKTSDDEWLAFLRDQRLRTLMSVDDMMSSLRTALYRLGEMENTLVIFTSDNGYLLAEHRLYDKREPYEVSTRVPFMMTWPRCMSSAPACPGALPPGTRDDRLVANIDIAPTILEAAGVTPEHVVDGNSVWSGERREYILIEYFEDRAVNTPDWAGFISPGEFIYRENYYDLNDGPPGCSAADYDDPSTGCERYVDQPFPHEYYDLRTDPYQLRNQLAASDSGTPSRDVDSLARKLAAARNCSGASCP